MSTNVAATYVSSGGPAPDMRVRGPEWLVTAQETQITNVGTRCPASPATNWTSAQLKMRKLAKLVPREAATHC